MNTVRDHLNTARNRLSHNDINLDLALGLAELHQLPSRHIRAIETLLADTKRLRQRVSNLAKRIKVSSTPPPH